MTPAILFLAITSTACPPCQALHRDFDEDKAISQWIDAGAPEAKPYRVRSVPVVIALRDGEEVGRHVGYQGKRELERWMESMEAKRASTDRTIQAAAIGAAARD